MDNLKVEALEETKAFYLTELESELAGGEREGYSKALKIIEKLIKKKKASSGAPGYGKNNYLNSEGGLKIIDKFPGIDFNSYEKERIRKEKIKR